VGGEEERVDSLVSQRLGPYLLEAELGRGSMGVVYRARHVEQGFTAAVKVLLDALVSDDSFVTRFSREARIVGALRHPNLLRLYDVGVEKGHIYFAMEYFAGSTAGHLLKERDKLPVGQVIEIAAQAADALDYVYAHGHVIHRDIKPENLLVDRWCRVKVLDFGLARAEGLQSITRAGTVVGSLYYVSPEQLMGRELDGRADVYALGVSMYEMLTSQRPYRGRSLNEMSEIIIAGKPVPPRQLEPSVPPSLEAIVLRAMARDLERRYPSAGELYADLRSLQAPASPPPTYHTGAPRSAAARPTPDAAAQAPLRPRRPTY
jgi:eukaryotic-like serine/threonine-protein kinase